MKKTFLTGVCLILATIFTCLTLAACGGGESDDKQQPSPVSPTSKTTVEWVYTSKEYTNAEGNTAKLDYAYYIPETEGNENLPLITWIPDSGCLRKSITEISELSSMPTIWATEENAETYPTAFLILTLTPDSTTDTDGSNYIEALNTPTSEESQVINIIDDLVARFNLDSDRLYYTGQSMGGIFGWALNNVYPEKFAATVYVSCQPGSGVNHSEKQVAMTEKILSDAEFLNQKFIFIDTRYGEGGGGGGQDSVEAVFGANGLAEGTDYKKYYELNSADPEGNSAYLKANVLSNDCSQYFLGFPAEEKIEHLKSFKPAYQITAILDWLLAQSRTA
ncbi:MAG: hypothetical protein ACI4MC_04995 [Candidatus Coproplasma sp.]